MFDQNDMILPEGFNPELGDQNFDEEGNLVEVPAQAEPTTATPEAEIEPSVEAQGEVQTTDSTISQETPAAEEPVQPKVKVKFNHEERELSLDEAAVYAQKGMNFDKVSQRAREQEEKLSRYESMAKMFGYDNAEAMMTQAEKNFVEVKVKDLMDQGNSEAISRFLVNQELANRRPTVSQPAQSEKAPGIPPERKAELDEFVAAYPGITKLPDEVIELNRGGVRLKTAYEFYQKQQELNRAMEASKAAQNELAILKQNQAAAVKAPVTGTTGKAAPKVDEPDDPFLLGFNKDY